MASNLAIDLEKFPILKGGVNQRVKHDSAEKQVSGRAVYTDDIPEPRGLSHIYIAQSIKAHALIKKLDISKVRSAPGVICVLSAEDIPGDNDFGYMEVGDDKVFADGKVECIGQSLFAVAAENINSARKAAKLAVVEYEDLEPVITIDQAMEKESFLAKPITLKQGDSDKALKEAPERLQGEIASGAQDHFYLEGQVSMAIVKEDGDVHVYSSTQDPSAVQFQLARILALPVSMINVEVRRMGGGFGGKETQAIPYAAIAALMAIKTGAPAKVRLDRDDDMIMTGKRHDAFSRYDVGFDNEGRIVGLDLHVALRAGMSFDQTIPVLYRCMLHCDNAYYLENVTIQGYPCKTNTVSEVAFRGFGTPQAYVLIERIIDRIAFHLDKDPLEIRKANFYGINDRNVTPYDWTIKDNVVHRITKELEESSDYKQRRKDIRKFNAKSQWLKKGIAMVSIKYSVGFGAKHLNQAGALIHIYQDGSIQLNHGGTEMGQGVNIKVAQVVAEVLQVDVEKIKITATTTEKVPNTSATAASTGADLNGAAAFNAAKIIKDRLIDFASKYFRVNKELVLFQPNTVKIGSHALLFSEFIELAYMNKIHLSAAGFYQNPLIEFDFEKVSGRPFHYSAYGSSVTEVMIDTLTGELDITRIDILHDVGKSLNPAIDYGQLEGGFIQGAGWLTTEEVIWDEAGELKTHAPSTYKIPVCSDRPADFRMKLVEWNQNVEETVFRSKAIGEPPLTMAVSVFNAITDAVSSVADYKVCPDLDAPATPERILMAVKELRAGA